MKAIKQDDILNVIYDSWYGLTLDKADKVVYDYTHGKLIPIEFIEEYISYQDTEEQRVLRMMWHAWELVEKENEI